MDIPGGDDYLGVASVQFAGAVLIGGGVLAAGRVADEHLASGVVVRSVRGVECVREGARELVDSGLVVGDTVGAVLAAGGVNSVAVEHVDIGFQNAGVEVDLLAALEVERRLVACLGEILHDEVVCLELLAVDYIHACHIHGVCPVGVLGDGDIAVVRKFVYIHVELVVKLVRTVLVRIVDEFLGDTVVEGVYLAEQVIDVSDGVLHLADVGILDLLELGAVVVEEPAQVDRGVCGDGSHLGGVRALNGVILERLEVLLGEVLQTVGVDVVEHVLDIR